MAIQVIREGEFYDETTRLGWQRRFSREVDFGVDWRGPDGQRGWLVSWVEDTGEVYATNGGSKYVLGTVFSIAELEARLKGWPILMATQKKGNTSWVESRLRPELLCDDCGRIDGHNYDVEH